MRQGILLFAHGAADPGWAIPFQTLAQDVREAAPATPVELAFLERMTPGFQDGVARLAAAECDDILVSLLFLSQGRHLKEDLPELIAEARQNHPRLRIRTTPALGDSDAFRALIAEWIVRQLRAS